MLKMPKNYKPKLVRDNIPAIIKQKGGKPEVDIASDEVYEKLLWEKLSEEQVEVDEATTRDKRTEEYADIITVLDALKHVTKKSLDTYYGETYQAAKKEGILQESIQKIKQEKLTTNGGFSKKLILKKW